jgi:hypothetical protein
MNKGDTLQNGVDYYSTTLQWVCNIKRRVGKGIAKLGEAELEVAL